MDTHTLPRGWGGWRVGVCGGGRWQCAKLGFVFTGPGDSGPS